MKRALSISICFLVLACSARHGIAPPVAERIPHTIRLHGETLTDDYYWLRDRSNPQVIAYLKAENEYTEAMMKPTEQLQKKLYEEIVGHIKESDFTVPERIDDYYYYNRTEKGKQYPFYCRKKDSMEASEEILLDQNQLASGDYFTDIGVLEISPNHRLLAYSIDRDGSEVYTLHFKDLTTGQMLRDQIPNTSYGVEWGNDNQTIFYNVRDAAQRPYRIYRHRIGTEPARDALVYEEADPHFHASFSKTRSEQYLFIETASNTTTEVHYLNANDPGGRFQVLLPRRHKVEYYVDHHSDWFYVLTNDRAKHFKLVKIPVNDPAERNEIEFLPERQAVWIDDFDLFENYLVVYEREKGVEKVRIQDLRTGAYHSVDFPENIYTVSATGNVEFRTDLLRFEYESLRTPTSLYDYNMNSREKTLLKKKEVIGYDPGKYEMERILAPAKDGVLVPISLMYRKGMVRNSKSPLYLYGYGAYGSNWEFYFSSDRLSLLDRGFIFGIAHIRGGGFLGRDWYEQGKLLNKKNAFTDYIACAEHLIREGYTSKELLVASGLSAGGTLMGAVSNLRPDLFRVIIACVPFVDAINTQLDPSIPLVVIEYEEVGNPAKEEFYRYIKDYSPYDNVEKKDYPAMLVTSGLNDTRVPFWEPAKWVAKLRANKTDKNLLLLKTDLGAGHSGPSGRYNELKETAFEYAFILYQLGLQ